VFGFEEFCIGWQSPWNRSTLNGSERKQIIAERQDVLACKPSSRVAPHSLTDGYIYIVTPVWRKTCQHWRSWHHWHFTATDYKLVACLQRSPAIRLTGPAATN